MFEPYYIQCVKSLICLYYVWAPAYTFNSHNLFVFSDLDDGGPLKNWLRKKYLQKKVLVLKWKKLIHTRFEIISIRAPIYPIRDNTPILNKKYVCVFQYVLAANTYLTALIICTFFQWPTTLQLYRQKQIRGSTPRSLY